jgi:hypothetical protein
MSKKGRTSGLAALRLIRVAHQADPARDRLQEAMGQRRRQWPGASEVHFVGDGPLILARRIDTNPHELRAVLFRDTASTDELRNSLLDRHLAGVMS